jgi:hypothetical protein
MNDKWSGPPPYFLRIADKSNPKSRTIAGAVFPAPFGQFNIVLNPGIVINWQDEVWITLVPNDKVHGGKLSQEPNDDNQSTEPYQDKGNDWPI